MRLVLLFFNLVTISNGWVAPEYRHRETSFALRDTRLAVDFGGLSRSELQSLSKEFGLKANVKSADLIQQLEIIKAGGKPDPSFIIESIEKQLSDKTAIRLKQVLAMKKAEMLGQTEPSDSIDEEAAARRADEQEWERKERELAEQQRLSTADATARRNEKLWMIAGKARQSEDLQKKMYAVEQGAAREMKAKKASEMRSANVVSAEAAARRSFELSGQTVVQTKQVSEQAAFDEYRQKRLETTRLAMQAAEKRRELALVQAQKLDEERWAREAKERGAAIDRELSIPKDTEIVPPQSRFSFKTSSAARKVISTPPGRRITQPLAVLSPEERAKMELSAAVVTFTALGFKLGGPIGAVAAASAARAYGTSGSAQGSVVRGMGNFFLGSVDLLQAVDRKFGVTEWLDTTVWSLLQRTVEEGISPEDPDATLKDMQLQQSYVAAKETLATGLAATNDLVKESMMLMDRVIDNVKKVEIDKD